MRDTPVYRQMVRLAERDGGWTCTYCGRPLATWDDMIDVGRTEEGGRVFAAPVTHAIPTRDHVVPTAMGGQETDDNLVLACTSCNSRKGRMSRDEFVESLR